MKQHRTSGFTLLEMMVVIALLVVVTTFAVPGFRKLYKDFKINEILDHVDTFFKGYRGYYLVNNELPPDSGTGEVKTVMVPYLPAHFFSLPPSGEYSSESSCRLRVNVYPNGEFDHDNWLSLTSGVVYPFRVFIGFYKLDANNRAMYEKKLKAIYPFTHVYNYSKWLYVEFSEFSVNSVQTESNTTGRNRYY